MSCTRSGNIALNKHQDSVSDQREHFKLMLQTYILQFTHTHIREEKYLLRNLANECLIKASLKALGELGKRLNKQERYTIFIQR